MMHEEDMQQSVCTDLVEIGKRRSRRSGRSIKERKAGTPWGHLQPRKEPEMDVKLKIHPISKFDRNHPLPTGESYEQVAGDGGMCFEGPTEQDRTVRVYIEKGRARRMRKFAKMHGLTFNSVVRIVLAETMGQVRPDEVPRLRGIETAFVGGTYQATAGPNYCQCPKCTANRVE